MRLMPVLMPVLITGYLVLPSLSGLLAGAALADPLTPTASDAATRMKSIQGPPGELTEQGHKLIQASARFRLKRILVGDMSCSSCANPSGCFSQENL
ncbi:hypothetical protein Thiowin_00522 [Thiorhodovibrio winogradskyi]|uniref:Uncharacterized protein n=1 Tax=Thiorhodovibrio winogradskyi TaxID=77007 RepID=A0ABZ0S5S7_9GAMM